MRFCVKASRSLNHGNASHSIVPSLAEIPSIRQDGKLGNRSDGIARTDTKRCDVRFIPRPDVEEVFFGRYLPASLVRGHMCVPEFSHAWNRSFRANNYPPLIG
jgi:hypothetical protein